MTLTLSCSAHAQTHTHTAQHTQYRVLNPSLLSKGKNKCVCVCRYWQTCVCVLCSKYSDSSFPWNTRWIQAKALSPYWFQLWNPSTIDIDLWEDCDTLIQLKHNLEQPRTRNNDFIVGLIFFYSRGWLPDQVFAKRLVNLKCVLMWSDINM